MNQQYGDQKDQIFYHEFDQIQYYFFSQSTLSMNYKKQLRWLLFLLIPFILMLGVHILIPIMIVSNSHGLQNQNYIIKNIKLWQNTLQSLSITNSLAVQQTLNKYIIPISQLYKGGSQQKLIFILESNNSLLSAYQFMQSIINNARNATVINSSMWFAPQCANYSQLSPSLKAIYDSYLQKELFLRSFAQQNSESALESTATLYATPNESIVFQYPTRYNADYANLSSDTFGRLFSSTVAQLQSSNATSVSTASLQWVSELNGNVLSLCLGSKAEGRAEVTCSQLSVAKLLKEVSSQLRIGVDMAVVSRTFLLLNTDPAPTDIGPQIIYEFNNADRTVVSPNSSFLSVDSVGLAKSVFAAKPFTFAEMLYVSRSGGSVNCRANIAVGDGSAMSALSLLTVSEFEQMGIESVGLEQNMNALIIPVVILIAIGSLISAVVIKTLLDSIDGELFELEHRCKFIVEGDIGIEIPEYSGTKDIRLLYEQVRVINKLHRCSTSSYFSGHFAEKILKYTEALQFITSLGYDTGNILENIGETYVLVDEWEKSIDALKKSVELGLSQLKEKFNVSLDEIFHLKIEKKPLPSGYKQFQIILMRRLFKLVFSFLRYVELRQIAVKTVNKTDEQDFKNKLGVLTKQWTEYLGLLKKAFYPSLAEHSESLISLIYQCKQYANLKNYEKAFKLLEGAKKCFKIYEQQYPQITKKLKQKGSKFKLFHQKNKISAQSRASPDIIKKILNMTINRIKINYQTNPQKYNEAMKLYAEGFKGSICTLGIYYVFMMDFRKFLIDLKIDPKSFESTQIFKQGAPFKTLHYGEITKEIEPQLLKFPTKISPGLEREYVFLVDCARNRDRNGEKLIDFFSQRSEHIFSKLMKPTDRLSIIKFNVKNGMKIECKLTLKESNEVILRKEISESFREPKQARGSFEEMVEAFYVAINRVKSLQSEKIVVMYFRSIAHYADLSERLIRKKKKTDISLKHSPKIEKNQSIEEEQGFKNHDFGQSVANAMRNEELRNCKVIFYCAMDDKVESFREFFGLQQINRRIWGNYNTKNNVVYIIDDKHRADIDRILMLKAQIPADNNVFIL